MALIRTGDAQSSEWHAWRLLGERDRAALAAAAERVLANWQRGWTGAPVALVTSLSSVPPVLPAQTFRRQARARNGQVWFEVVTEYPAAPAWLGVPGYLVDNADHKRAGAGLLAQQVLENAFDALLETCVDTAHLPRTAIEFVCPEATEAVIGEGAQGGQWCTAARGGLPHPLHLYICAPAVDALSPPPASTELTEPVVDRRSCIDDETIAIEIQIGATEITLHDWAQLAPGDVLVTGIPLEGLPVLRTAETCEALARVRLGRQGGHWAARVEAWTERADTTPAQN
jgi:hypothetical protein